MKNYIKNTIQFIKDEEGLTTVEYVVGAGLLVGGLAVFFAGYSGILSTEFDSLF
ncbi:Flp family type IVb pilin [Vibrio profundum]|uniref:Flp family type IVb pilin n=1 Tax=Vibrio profundum TaxID=2910247 RepID=UPI003D109066